MKLRKKRNRELRKKLMMDGKCENAVNECVDDCCEMNRSDATSSELMNNGRQKVAKGSMTMKLVLVRSDPFVPFPINPSSLFASSKSLM